MIDKLVLPVFAWAAAPCQCETLTTTCIKQRYVERLGDCKHQEQDINCHCMEKNLSVINRHISDSYD